MGKATSFEMSLRAPISEARAIGELMLKDAIDVGGIGLNGGKPAWPPVVTPDELVARLDVYSDSGGDFDDRMDRKTHEKIVTSKLATWASEGFFEVLPLPNRRNNNVAFRITPAGARAVKSSVEFRIEELRIVHERASKATSQRKS